MGTYRAIGADGRWYRFTIKGEEPTPEELAKADRVLFPQAAPPKEEAQGSTELMDYLQAGRAGIGDMAAAGGYLFDNPGMSEWGERQRQEAARSMSPAAIQSQAEGVWGGGGSAALGLGASRAIPGIVGTLGATAAGLRFAPQQALSALGRTALARIPGMSGIAGRIATAEGITLEQAAAKLISGSLAGAGAEGLISAGMSGDDAKRAIMLMAQESPDTFRNSPIGAKYLALYAGDYTRAAEAASDEIARDIAIKTGLTSGAMALPGAGIEAALVGRGLRGGLGGALQGAGLGASQEALEEAGQSGMEQIYQNQAMQRAGSSVNTFDNAGRAAAEGAAIGGVLGGGFGALGGGLSSRLDAYNTRLKDLENYFNQSKEENGNVNQLPNVDVSNRNERPGGLGKFDIGPYGKGIAAPTGPSEQSSPGFTTEGAFDGARLGPATVPPSPSVGYSQDARILAGLGNTPQDAFNSNGSATGSLAAMPEAGNFVGEMESRGTQFSGSVGEMPVGTARSTFFPSISGTAGPVYEDPNAVVGDRSGAYQRVSNDYIDGPRSVQATFGRDYLKPTQVEFDTMTSGEAQVSPPSPISYNSINIGADETLRTGDQINTLGIESPPQPRTVKVKAVGIKEGAGIKLSPGFSDATNTYFQGSDGSFYLAGEEDAGSYVFMPEKEAAHIDGNILSKDGDRVWAVDDKGERLPLTRDFNIQSSPKPGLVPVKLTQTGDNSFAAQAGSPIQNVWAGKDSAPAPINSNPNEAANQPLSTQAPEEDLSSILPRVRENLQKKIKGLGLPEAEIKLIPDLGGPEASATLMQNRPIFTIATRRLEGKSAAEVESELSAIMDHELIHGLFSVGVVSNQEKAKLFRFVRERPFVDREGMKRSFTWLEWADQQYRQVYQSSNPTAIEDVIYEEAIAEAFRSWAKNKSAAPGLVNNLFQRIVQFFKKLSEAISESGGERVFRKILDGEMTNRPRNIQESVEKYSLPDNPEARKWWSNSKVVDENGQPLVVYHGTSKDKPFSSFKAGQRGAWFTENPDEASMYAKENDSMGHTYEGGRFVPKNTAARVIPAYLSIQNPYTLTEEDINFLKYASSYSASQRVLFNRLRAAGHDGVKMGGGVWVAFDPAQIKSPFNTFEEGASTSVKYSLPTIYNIGARVPPSPTLGQQRLLDISYAAAYDSIYNMLNKGYRGAQIFTEASMRKTLPEQPVYNAFRMFQSRAVPLARFVDMMRKGGGHIDDALNPIISWHLMRDKINQDTGIGTRDFIRPAFESINSMPFTEADVRRFQNHMQGLDRDLALQIEDVMGVKPHYSPSMKMLLMWGYARHAPERNRYLASKWVKYDEASKTYLPNFDPQKNGAGITDSEAQYILEYFSRNHDTTRMAAAIQPLYDLISETNRINHQGLLAPDWASHPDTLGFQYYLPLVGKADMDGAYMGSMDASLSVRGREVKRAFGRESLASDIFEESIRRLKMSINRSNHNAMMNDFIDMIEQNPDSTDGLAEVLMTYPVQTVDRGKSFGSVKMPSEADPLIVTAKNLREDADGNQESYLRMVRLNPNWRQLADFLNGKDVQKPGDGAALVKFMLGYNRFIGSILTRFNPEFMFSNVFRDVITAGFNVGQYPGVDQVQVAQDAFKAIKSIYKKERDPNYSDEYAELYELARRNGALTTDYGLDDPFETVEKLVKEMHAKPNKAKQIWDGTFKYIVDTNSAFENASRISVMKHMLKAGYSERAALNAAKTITVNFDEGGTLRNAMNAGYLFFNASIQGTFGIFMAAARSPKVAKQLGGILAAGAIIDLINYAISPEDDQGNNLYDQIQDYVKEHNLIIMSPAGTGYIKIPLPYGYHSVYNAGRNLMGIISGRQSPGAAIGSTAKSVVEGFNPLGGTNSWLNFFSPTILDPWVDLSLNQNFAGINIYPEAGGFGPQPPKSQLYWNSTNPAYNLAAELLRIPGTGTDKIPGMGLEVSPNEIQYVLETFTGGIGMFMSRLSNLGIRSVTGDFQDMEVNDVPLARKLLGNVGGRTQKQEFYDLRDRYELMDAEIRDAKADGEMERIRYQREKHPDMWANLGRFKTLNNRRNKLVKAAKDLENNSRIPDDRKREQIDRLKKAADDLMLSIIALERSRE